MRPHMYPRGGIGSHIVQGRRPLSRHTRWKSTGGFVGASARCRGSPSPLPSCCGHAVRYVLHCAPQQAGLKAGLTSSQNPWCWCISWHFCKASEASLVVT